MPLFSQKCSHENGFHPCSLRRLAAVSLLAGFIFLAGAELSRAATIAMNTNDAINTSSFNSGLHWAGGAAPVAGNAYQTAAFVLRTPQTPRRLCLRATRWKFKRAANSASRRRRRSR